MRVAAGDTQQKRLCIHNKTVPDADGYADMLAIERQWAVRLADEFEADAPKFGSAVGLLSTLNELLRDDERAYPSAAERFIA